MAFCLCSSGGCQCFDTIGTVAVLAAKPLPKVVFIGVMLTANLLSAAGRSDAFDATKVLI